MTTATTGTGTITLGSPSPGFQSFADAGVANGDVVSYVIEDGDNWEIGTGTYAASGTTLSRGATESNNSGNAINLSGSAEVFISVVSSEIVQPSNLKTVNGNSLIGSGDVEIEGSGGSSVIISATEPTDVPEGTIWLDTSESPTFQDIFELAQANGFTGDFNDFLNFMRGPQGDQGAQGIQGPTGPAGNDAEFILLNQAQYDALDPPEPGVLYLIEEE